MVQLTEDQRVTGYAQALTASGGPGAVVGDIVWESSNPTVCSLEARAIGNPSMDLVAQQPGTATLTVTAQSTDPTVPALVQTTTVTVQPGAARTLLLTFDPPRAK